MNIPGMAVALVLGLVTTGTSGNVDEIYQSIQRGKWRQAADQLAQIKEINNNGNLLFLSGLLERSADRAARFFEAALERSVDVAYQEEIYFRLAHYYLQTDKLSRVAELTNEYRTRFERGKYRAPMARLRILAEELDGDRSAALGLNETYRKNFGKGEAGDWGKVDLARILLGSRGDETGVEEFEKLSLGSSAIAVPQAMVLLGQYHLNRDEPEEAMRFYQLLREEYPSAVGLDHLARQLGESAPTGLLSSTGKREGTTEPAELYTIQVGAFSSERFAKEQVTRLQRERLPSRIEKRETDGKTLWVVLVGEFKDLRSAESACAKLQKQYGETYKVVPR